MARKYILSTAFQDCFLSLDGRGVTKHSSDGGGRVMCQDRGSTWELVEIEPVRNDVVALKSTTFRNVYVRMDARHLKSGDGGVVNLQFGRGEWEEFRIRPQAGNKVTIESVAFPGVYLRMDGNSGRNGPGFGYVNARVGAKEWETFELIDIPAKLTADEVRQAIGTYGPLLRFYSEEHYLMCSIEYFLSHSTLRSSSGVNIKHPSVDQLPTKKTSDTYWLEVENDSLGGDLSTAKAYVHALYRAESTYTDLQFWFFYAFNGHASLAASLEVGIGPISKSFSLDQSINPIGEHYGDWECCMIRIDNIKKSMIGIWLSQHSGGQYFNKFGLPAFEKNGKAAIVYASNNGHAVFSETGNNITEGINKSLGVAKIKAGLYNVTGKGGKSLDSRTRYEVVATNWLEKDFPEKRWVAYPYRWGPTGGTPYDLQKVIDTIIRALPGPANIGPVRDLIGEVVRKIAGALPDNVDGPEGPALKDQWRGIYG